MMKRSLIGLRARRRPRPLAGPVLMLFLLAFDAVSFTNAFIVPEELPSILSLVYSNIPPIKKVKEPSEGTSSIKRSKPAQEHVRVALAEGTDSRIGFGFRLGEHADFQVQLELGPQLNTRPIGPAAGSSKRYVDNDEYANSVRAPTRNSGTASWLQAWSKQTKQRQQFNKDKLRDSLMPPAPVMNEGAYNQLQQLYEMNKQREYEDTIGTLPAEVLESRINQLKALHNPSNTVSPFKPMPNEPRATGGETKAPTETDTPQQPSEPMGIIVVTPDVPAPTSTLQPTESTTVKEKEQVRDTVNSDRRNVRRRTNRPVSKRDKERITAQLSDVSLD